MNFKAHYVSQAGYLPEHVCNDIINFSTELGAVQAGVGNLNKDGGDVNLDVRKSKITWLETKWIADWIVPFVSEVNQQVGWNFDLDSAESFQYTTYNEGEYYGWHQDSHIGDPDERGFKRKLSLTILLNHPEEYEGGEFQLINTSMAPHEEYDKRVLTISELKQKGSVLMFPSYLYHQVTKVTKGTRKSLVCWFSGKDFR